MKKLIVEESGQGMTEYGLIIALVALVALASLSSGLAPSIAEKISNSKDKVLDAMAGTGK